MKIQTFEIESLTVVNPTLLPDIDGAIFASSDWDALTPSPERRELDAAVFDALRLTAGRAGCGVRGGIGAGGQSSEAGGECVIC